MSSCTDSQCTYVYTSGQWQPGMKCPDGCSCAQNPSTDVDTITNAAEGDVWVSLCVSKSFLRSLLKFLLRLFGKK
jgi:hypothetical protein